MRNRLERVVQISTATKFHKSLVGQDCPNQTYVPKGILHLSDHGRKPSQRIEYLGYVRNNTCELLCDILSSW